MQRVRGLPPPVKELDRLCTTVPLEEPWNAPDAELLDKMTLQDWLDSRSCETEAARLLLIGASKVRVPIIKRHALEDHACRLEELGGRYEVML